jgi:ribulose 1,5-bisphosphate synthetase/thiazole synthase
MPVKVIHEMPRDIPVIAEPDVLVVGGGAAGIAAACAAARGGAKTLLIERYGFLGGTFTAVTLGGICGTHMIVDEQHLERVVGGLYLELEARLIKRNGFLQPLRHGKIVGSPYDSESFKLVADDMMAAHGVTVMHHTYAVAVQSDQGRVQAVVVESKAGRGAIVPRVVIDTTGDGDVAAHAGAGYDSIEGGERQFGSTMFRFTNVDVARAKALSRPEMREILEGAVKDGYELPRTTIGVHINPVENITHVNVTKLGNSEGRPFNLMDPVQLSEAERTGRRQVALYEEVFRKYMPGYENSRVVDIGAVVGIREGRRIHGDKTLLESDVRNCVKPADRIAVTSWALEKHGAGRDTIWDFLPDGEWYGIPYGCLLVKGFDNLVVAGRNLSASHMAQASARIGGACMAMGEAIGTAAAMSLALDATPRALAVDRLQAQLEREGAILTPGA